MSYYRLYFLDRDTNAIRRFEEIHADSDDAAIALARTHAGDHALELWCGNRRVHIPDARNPAAAGRETPFTRGTAAA